MRSALVCIAKEEDNCIQEWVDYHKKLGFDHIFIYQNDWVCTVEDSIVTKLTMNGLNKQLVAYNHFIDNFSQKFDYAAFFDVDEFLVLKKHQTVNDFLNAYGNPNGIGVNWRMFGSGGQKTVNELGIGDSVLKRFTRRESADNEGMKTMLNLSSGGQMVLPHNPNIPIFDTTGRRIVGPANPNGSYDVAQLNHYMFKSYEEFITKVQRGRADMVVSNRKTSSWFERTDKDIDVEDLLALNFLYGN